MAARHLSQRRGVVIAPSIHACTPHVPSASTQSNGRQPLAFVCRSHRDTGHPSQPLRIETLRGGRSAPARRRGALGRVRRERAISFRLHPAVPQTLNPSRSSFSCDTSSMESRGGAERETDEANSSPHARRPIPLAEECPDVETVRAEFRARVGDYPLTASGAIHDAFSARSSPRRSR